MLLTKCLKYKLDNISDDIDIVIIGNHKGIILLLKMLYPARNIYYITKEKAQSYIEEHERFNNSTLLIHEDGTTSIHFSQHKCIGGVNKACQ